MMTSNNQADINSMESINKVIVTGGSGFIGGHIVDRLVASGKEVLVIDDESAQCNESFYKNNDATYYKKDISSYKEIESLFEGIDVVFHLAAESRIQPSLLNPIKATKTNVLGTCNVLQASRDYDVDRVIYSSTSACYGLINTPPLVENMPQDHLNPYSLTKCAGEDLCLMYHKLFQLKTISLRYFNVYGDRAPISAATTNNTKAFGEIFNIGTGASWSILSLANFIGGEYNFTDARIGEARHTLSDSTKARHMLGWTPIHSIFEYLEKEISRV